MESKCRPRLKESEGISWRRKSSSKSKRRRSTTPPRPTLLLPPMRFTGSPSPEGATVPVLTTRVQQSAELPPEALLCLDGIRTPLPRPSAPSPGHLFYNSEDHSDLTFIVGSEEWRFPAHSFILGKTPDTLSSLLESAQGPHAEIRDRLLNMEVGSDPVQPVVFKMPNMQPDLFEQILRYIYTGQITFLTVDSTLRLLHPSRAYHLPSLTSHCLNHISENIDPSNVLQVLSRLSRSHSDLTSESPLPTAEDCHDNDNLRNELVDKCFLLVDRHADCVLLSEHFETLEHELMVEIVKRDTLDITSESVIFDSVMRWACRACKKQRMELTAENKCSILGKALFLVRYLTMTPEEFLRGPVSQGVLSKEDKECFLARLADPDNHTPLPDRWSGWNISKRRSPCRIPLNISSPNDLSRNVEVDIATTPLSSTLPVSSKRTDRKKKSMSKKLLNGVGDFVICVIQLLD